MTRIARVALALAMVVLAWVYYSSQILFFGAEFTKVYAHTFGSRADDAAGAAGGAGAAAPAMPAADPAAAIARSRATLAAALGGRRGRG